MSDQLNFFNTVEFTGSTLDEALATVEKQGDRILTILQHSPNSLTPFEVPEIYCTHFPEIPITSVRRAMTDLTHAGKLLKLSEMKEGKYGTLNYKWRAA